MFAQDQQSLEAWMKPSQDMFNYWISFFPTAPLFGVDYRFGDVLGQGANFGFPVNPTTPTPAAKPETVAVAPVAYERVAQPKTPPAAEVAEVAKPAAKAKPEKPIVAKPAPVAAEVEAKSPADVSEGPVKPKGLLAKAPADADDLKLIKGVGPGLEQQLNGLGIYRFRQLAKFKEADLTWVDENLSSFKGRCFRDDWVGQSKALKT